MLLTDDLGRRLTLDRPARRVVSLVPGHTELLFEIGASASIAGLTSFCNRPAGRPLLPVVGGVRDPDLNAIRELEPDLVLSSFEENRKEDVLALEESGVRVIVTRTGDVRSALASMTLIGKAVGAWERTMDLVARICAGLDSMAVPRVPARVAYIVWEDPLVLPGTGTFVSDMLRRAGAVSVGEDLGPNWPRATLADLEGGRVDAVILPTEPYAHSVETRARWLRTGSVAACAKGRVFLVDGDLVNRAGPCILEGIEEIRKALSEP